jgi:membrane fusion protein, copper/silver efflux system
MNSSPMPRTSYLAPRTSYVVPRTSYVVPRIALLVLLLLVSCTAKDAAHEQDAYTCPMHPTVTSDKPGTCSVCGMDLVRKARPGEELKITEDIAKLSQSPNEAVVASIKTVKGQYKSVSASVQAQGRVTYDTRNAYVITSRVAGRLEKVYLKYAFQTVTQGQRVAEIYSPELNTAQRELLFLMSNDPENKDLIGAAKSKLELLGFTASQIEDLIKTRKVGNTVTIYSSHSGYLVPGQQTSTSGSNGLLAAQPPTTVMRDGMNTAPSASKQSVPVPRANGTSIVREGNYIAAGEPLANIINTNALWVELDLPSSQAVGVRKSHPINLDFGNGLTQTSEIDFIQPFFNEGENFVKLRVYIKNPGALQIGQLVKATIKLTSPESLWVPREAVMDQGIDKIVFVKDHETFKPIKVITGGTSPGLTEIRKGLSSADEIAANAHYLVDSESFIKVETRSTNN